MLGSIDVAPFSFDPNTASGWLTVSEDLTSVTNYGYSFLIDTPERFVFGPCILGSTSFSEGSHHWEVNLGNVQSWRVGVSRNIDYHKNAFKHESKTGYWYIYHVDGMSGIWCWVSNSSKTELPLTSPLKRIRVELDCDEGELSFYDTDNNSHLYTFHDNFSLNVFPYFYVGSLQPNAPAESLKICPIKISLQDCPPL
ncbi:E3 ubiquitin-protein ligase TRIM35 [Ascaphus truei]|uniref:E3 ubiquitin-protein ligase TRIM35 n=1 Tax=Ascaphus truei TaxID=8439 RepID=UPI003F5AA83C